MKSVRMKRFLHIPAMQPAAIGVQVFFDSSEVLLTLYCVPDTTSLRRYYCSSVVAIWLQSMQGSSFKFVS